jgi:hypothetical protein
VRFVDTTNRRRLGVLGPLLVTGALVFAACSSGDESAVTQTTGSEDSKALCAIFDELAAHGAGPGAQFAASTPEGWQRRIETNRKMVDAAPAEWRDEAETYLQMVKDRAQLAAENGYVGVNELPADVRDAFISSHRAMQAEVNELIAYMGRECGARSSG